MHFLSVEGLTDGHVREKRQEGGEEFTNFAPSLPEPLFTSGAVATAKSRAPKVRSEEGEVEVWVIFPPGKI